MHLELKQLNELEFICELAERSLCPEKEQGLIKLIRHYRLVLLEEIQLQEIRLIQGSQSVKRNQKTI